MRTDIRHLAPVRPCRPDEGRDRGSAAQRLWRAWRQRRELRRLAEFDDRMLSDVGVSRGEVERELARPFWHAVDRGPCARRHRAPS